MATKGQPQPPASNTPPTATTIHDYFIKPPSTFTEPVNQTYVGILYEIEFHYLVLWGVDASTDEPFMGWFHKTEIGPHLKFEWTCRTKKYWWQSKLVRTIRKVTHSERGRIAGDEELKGIVKRCVERYQEEKEEGENTGAGAEMPGPVEADKGEMPGPVEGTKVEVSVPVEAPKVEMRGGGQAKRSEVLLGESRKRILDRDEDNTKRLKTTSMSVESPPPLSPPPLRRHAARAQGSATSGRTRLPSRDSPFSVISSGVSIQDPKSNRSQNGTGGTNVVPVRPRPSPYTEWKGGDLPPKTPPRAPTPSDISDG